MVMLHATSDNVVVGFSLVNPSDAPRPNRTSGRSISQLNIQRNKHIRNMMQPYLKFV